MTSITEKNRKDPIKLSSYKDRIKEEFVQQILDGLWKKFKDEEKLTNNTLDNDTLDYYTYNICTDIKLIKKLELLRGSFYMIADTAFLLGKLINKTEPDSSLGIEIIDMINSCLGCITVCDIVLSSESKS